MSTIKTFADAGALTEAAAHHVLERLRAGIDARGMAILALAGGSTPRALYARLAQPDLASQVDWAAVHVFWGDERAVPPDHPDSNFRMAHETWLSHVPIPEANIHRIQGEMAPAAAAAAYEGELRVFFGARTKKSVPLEARFDLVLLGMGDDGHTASLFPGAEAIDETRRWVAGYFVEKLDVWRISLTPVAINAAAWITFLVAGEHKATRLRQVLYGPYKPQNLPAQIIRPRRGNLLWMIDAGAAGNLTTHNTPSEPA